MTSTTLSIRSLLFALALAGAGAAPVAAQGGARDLAIALPDEFPAIDAKALVIRERARDVIVLRPGEVTPEALAMSLLVLRDAGARNPDPTTGEMIPITGFVFTVPLRPDERDRLARALAELRRQPVAHVGSLGPGRWIRLPSR